MAWTSGNIAFWDQLEQTWALVIQLVEIISMHAYVFIEYKHLLKSAADIELLIVEVQDYVSMYHNWRIKLQVQIS